MSSLRGKSHGDNAEMSKAGTAKSTGTSKSKFSKLGLGKMKQQHEEEEDEKSWWGDVDETVSTNSAATGVTWREKGWCQKKVEFTQFGDFPKEVLTVKMDQKPTIENPTDVIIKVEASTVSLNDCLVRRGMCFQVLDPVCLPVTPGYDVVGTISELGDDVDHDEWKKGDRVAALIRTGGNARYAVVSQDSLVHVPKSLDPAEAVCMVTTYTTAYQSLKMTLNEKERSLAKPMEGKKVLVVGGVGPVGQALIQLARKAGAVEVYATGPQHHHRYIRTTLGAIPLPYEPEEWLPEVEEQMDLVFDGACQDGYESSHAALNKDGKLVTVGMYARLQQEEPGFLGAPFSAFWTDTKAALFMPKTSSYAAWASFKSDPEAYKADMEKLFNKLKKRQIKPMIAKRVTLGDVADAHLFLEKGKARGPVVCMPWRRGKRLREKDHIPLVIETTATEGPPEEQREPEPVEQEERAPQDEEGKKKDGRKRRSLFGRKDKREKEEDAAQRDDGGKKEEGKGGKSPKRKGKNKGQPQTADI